MNSQQRILLLTLIMTVVAIGVAGIMMFVLYNVSFEQQRARLVETAQSQAHLIETITQFIAENDADFSNDPDSFEQVEDAYEHFERFGETSEFLVGRQDGDQIVFLLHHHHSPYTDYHFDMPAPVPVDSELAEPMRRALAGKSGTVVGLDYQGETVLAAYEPVERLKLGIVVKTSLTDIQAPFFDAGLLAGWGGFMLVMFGTALFWRISDPLIRHLEESERRYRILMEQASDGIFICNKKGDFSQVNTKACDMLGYTQQELLRYNVRDIVKGKLPPFDKLRLGETMLTECLILHKNGHIVPVEASIKMIDDSQIQSIVRDITERKRVELEQARLTDELKISMERLHQFVTSISDHIYVSEMRDDGRSINIYLSSHIETLTGYPLEEFITDWRFWGTTVIHPDDRAEASNQSDRLAAGQNSEIEYRLVRNDGKIIWVRDSARAERKGSKVIVYGVVSDITERRKTEDELARELAIKTALAELYTPLISSTSIQYMAQVILNWARVLTNSEHGYVSEVDPLTGDNIGHTLTEMLHGQCDIPEEDRQIVFPIGDDGLYGALWGHSLNTHRAFYTNNPPVHSTSKGLPGGHVPLQNFLSVPVVLNAELVGQIALANPGRDYTDDDLGVVQRLAEFYALAIQRRRAEDTIQQTNTKLAHAYDETLAGWARALELRDKETEGHSQRVTDMTIKFARLMGMNENELIHVRRGALLHDIGKMGVPDYILLKPGPLTDHEWSIMRKHPVFARQMLSPITYLQPALEIPYCHHERWDGTGYPRGLKSDEIPLSARIFTVVDVWDALTSDRPYRKAWSWEKVRQHIWMRSGTHFDPKVVEVFMKIVKDG
jgi:PAS domain S-box-containing protein